MDETILTITEWDTRICVPDQKIREVFVDDDDDDDDQLIAIIHIIYWIFPCERKTTLEYNLGLNVRICQFGAIEMEQVIFVKRELLVIIGY